MLYLFPSGSSDDVCPFLFVLLLEFAFYEHIFTGALDHGNLRLARDYLHTLQAHFPGSSRVRRLEGMLAESAGGWVCWWVFSSVVVSERGTRQTGQVSD